MNGPPAAQAILFADISGSTKLYEQHGDTTAREIVGNCLAVLASITGDCQGRVVKTIGDELMAVFPQADLAADAAARMQETTGMQSLANGIPVSIRVGFHFGPVLEENGDLFGDTVNIAAHVAAQAKALQILTTRETIAALPAESVPPTRTVDTVRFKGREQPVELCELLWGQQTDQTITGGPAHVRELRPARLNVRYGQQEIVLDESRTVLTIGRADQNEMIVARAGVSRLHARIEYRRGQFVLIEQSTNGTEIRRADGKQVFLHRDQMPLEGSGVIRLGCGTGADEPVAIHYTCGS